jgi:diguanylate cyclase (GGDEF)-like protein
MLGDSHTQTVLVVEDDPHMAELLSFNLSEQGFRVFVAANGAEAVKKLEIVAVDMIVCDIMLPVMDGLAFRERLLEKPALRDTPFIFLTAKTLPEDQIRGLSMGVDEYVTKPFDPQVLVARIKAVLHRRETYARVARLDPLTGLLNRQSLERAVDRELARIKRYPAVASIVFLDIDGFKQVNDQFGHAAGDRALVNLAAALTKDVRSVDIIGRFGGEEFILFFPETSKDAAIGIVDRMHHRFQELSKSDGCGMLTFSAGIAEAPEDGADFKTLCARADQAMYAAKRQGKALILGWAPAMNGSSIAENI